MTNHVEPWLIMAFEALASGNSEAFTLIPCFVGETPSVAIAHVQPLGPKIAVMPLFVGITHDMNVTYPDAESDGGEGGGPKRDGIREHFAANKAMTALTDG